MSKQGLIHSYLLRGAAPRHQRQPAQFLCNFAGKKALLAAVAASGFVRFTEALRAAKGRNAGKRLAAIGRAYCTFARQNAGLLRLMFGPREGPDRSSPELVAASGDAYAELYGAVCAVLEKEGLAIDRAHVASLAVWSLVHGLSNLMLDQVGPITASGFSDDARWLLQLPTPERARRRHSGETLTGVCQIHAP